MQRTILSFCVALCVLAAPAIAAESKVTVPFNRMLRLMDTTYARFVKEANRDISALRRIDKLERADASDERIIAVINETKFALEVRAARLRNDLEDFNTATDLVIDRYEFAASQQPLLPSVNFDGLRVRADNRTDSLDAKADLLLDNAFEKLEERTPIVEMPEFPF